MVVDKTEWQAKGGSLEIPDGWFVTHVNLDSPEPYCDIEKENEPDQLPQRVIIPKSLAYYLSVHHCGSTEMRQTIVKETESRIAYNIRKSLMID